jgi:hypothetical protein
MSWIKIIITILVAYAIYTTFIVREGFEMNTTNIITIVLTVIVILGFLSLPFSNLV